MIGFYLSDIAGSAPAARSAHAQAGTLQMGAAMGSERSGQTTLRSCKNAPILGSPLEGTNAIWPNEAMKAAGASTEASQEIFMPRRPTKKNPFMSLWLSGANKVAGTGLGLWRAAARRQRSAMFRAADELSASYWNEALKTLFPGKRRNSGK